MSNLFKDDPNLPNVIELKNVNQVYGNHVVLQDLNLLIEDKPNQNQFIVIVGPSGCGKSTILRYIANLQEPTSGTVLVNDKPCDPKNPIGMVFQQYSSVEWRTVLDNVAFGPELKGIKKSERRKQAKQMIELMGLKGHENKYASYPALSGGQLQRVAIGRSLLANPQILLMDEPFGALDIHTRFQMQDLLQSIWTTVEQMTVVMITHDIEEAVYLADEILVMSSNPGMITHRIKIDLSLQREQSIKKTSKFLKYVDEVRELILK